MDKKQKKEINILKWPYEQPWQVVFLMFITLVLIGFFIFSIEVSKNTLYIFVVVSIVYLILLKIELEYLTKIYIIESEDLNWDKKQDEGKTRAIIARKGLIGSSMGQSQMYRVRKDGENALNKRILKYKRDYIRSIIVPISALFK